MDRTGHRWLLAVAVAVLALLAVPAPALAQLPEEMPDVTGLPVKDADTKLTEWNKAVLIVYDPAPAEIDLPADQVFVSRQSLRQNTVAASNRPIVDLVLGRRVPDLARLTFDQAEAAARAVQLRIVDSGAHQPDWLVVSQRPAPGTIVEFATANRAVSNVVTVVLAAAAPSPAPTVEPKPMPVSVIVLVASASALGLGLLVLLATLALRRAGRRRRAPTAGEHIEVRGSPGQVIGPELTEPGPGASMSVRLEPHYDRGTFQLQEADRQ